MEYMSHLVEERDDIVMAHQSWFVGGWLGEVSHHSGKGVATRSIGFVVS